MKPTLRSRSTRLFLGALLALGVLAPQLASRRAAPEAPWLEEGFPRAFATPRPSLPGESSSLECTGLVPAGLRLRLHRVKEPGAFLDRLLTQAEGQVDWQGTRGSRDPLDVLREAFLWGGRRAFSTAHRTATRGLRDVARESDALRPPLTTARDPRPGTALALEGRSDLSLVQELIPESPEGQPTAILLPAQPAGLYVLEVLLKDEVAYVPWLVTDLALLAEQDSRDLRVSVLSARDGAPVAGAEGRLVGPGQRQTLAFDGQGQATVAAGPGQKRFVWARKGDALAVLASEGLGAASPRQRVFAFTERPLYRPGQEVFVKAIVRTVTEGENTVPSSLKAMPFRVLDPEDTEVAKGEAALLSAETASFGARIQLPNAGRLGLYRVVFQGPEGPAQAEFKVEQFVKPSFQVTVDSELKKVGVGDALSFEVKARYFYGAAVVGAQAEWLLYQVRPSLSWWDADAGPAPVLKESGTLELDEQGQATVTGLKATEEGLWRLVVRVTDASGQRNGGQAQVRCAKGDLVVFLSPDRELVAPGEPFKASVRVQDLEGNEVSGVPVTIKACAIRFTQRGKEQAADPGWGWSYQHRPGEVYSQGQGPTATLTLPKAGLFLLHAEAKDRSGRTIEALRPINVAADHTPLPPVADLKALADRKEYRVGDTAKVLVRLPKPNLTLRWSLEGERLGERHLRKVPGTSAVVEIPLREAHQPNAWAVFEIFHDGRRQMVEVPLRVPKVDKRLQVEVRPDRDRYEPGGPMRVAVSVKDHQGRPTRADLSVGVVDEAIYALSAELHPDPFRFFHPVRRHLVMRSGSTDWSFFDLLRRTRDVSTLKKTAKGEFKSDDEKIRKNFKDTAHWAPFVAVGADGQATVDLTLPDNLTAWRTTALAVTPATQVGVGRASRPASKPLQVSLTVPRTLTKGDTSRAIALVRNLSGRTLEGRVRLEVQNGRLEGPAEGAFRLEDQGQHRFAVSLATDQPGALVVTARVEGGGLKDGEQQRVPVFEPLVAASVSGALVMDGAPRALDIPAPPRAQGAASVVFTPVGQLEQLLLPSLPYLIQYPYGCVEQTLSSFMPNVLVADLVKRRLAPEIEWKRLTDLDRNIKDGVFRVYGYQLPNGGWGWWSPKDFGPESNPHTTGYALQSFATMKRLGYAVDEGVYRRGREAALRLFEERARAADEGSARAGEDPAADAAFVLVSLARTGEPVQGLLDSSLEKALAGRWKGGHVLAFLAQAAAESRHPRTAAAIAALEKAAVQKGGLAWWQGPPETGSAYHGGDLVPTATALKALALASPKSPLLASGEAFLASRHQGWGWSSTWATSQILELVPYLARTRSLVWEAPDLKVAVEGGPSFDFKALKLDPYRPWKNREPRPGSVPLASPRALKAQVQGRGLLLWTYSHQVAGGGAEERTAAGAGTRLDLKRNLWKLRSPLQTGNARQGWIRQPWTGTLAVGEEAWLELELHTERPAQYAILEVPIPAGLEPIVKLEGFVLEGKPFSEEGAADASADYDGEEGYRILRPRIEVHPDKVSFLVPALHSWSPTKVRILLRASLAGTYRFRPPKLSLMSDETQWTALPGLDLTVKEGGAR